MESRRRSPAVGRTVVLLSSVMACVGFAGVTRADRPAGHPEPQSGTLHNEFPFINEAGTAATLSTSGFVDLTNEFRNPQGTNGRSCQTCHLVQSGWSVRPADVEDMFRTTEGTHPIFNLLDANSPTADVSTVEARYASYSMLRKGLFRRGGNPPANSEFEILAVDDPLGAGGSTTRF